MLQVFPLVQVPQSTGVPQLFSFVPQTVPAQVVVDDSATQMQRPLLQMWPAGQETPHAPQLVLLVARFVSQPSAALPLQFANPALQVPTWHCPLTQTAEPLATLQTFPHAPQLEILDAMFVSQPSPAFPLQFANPVLHVPVHTPLTQADVPLAKLGQTVPHAPQLLTSLERVRQVPLHTV
ncbi:MAG TPA: hypothetical protein VM143_12900 [Acidimicrobiales bacterium]|nr:hypothetical protein [Acidimicrobiales bacterium]